MGADDRPIEIPRASSDPGAPPWLWLWIGFFVINLPALWNTLVAGSLQYLETERDGLARLRAIDPHYGRFDALRMAGVAVDWFAPIILVAGIVTTLLPWVRRRYVERRYGLRDPATAPPGFAAIHDFIQRHAPGVAVTTNLLRRESAFVYPLGYRRAAVAVCGGLYKIWQTDRPAAEAILLHELAHCRRGDFLVLGTGSPISSGLKYAFLCFVLVLALPHLIISVDDAVALRARVAALQQQVAPAVLPNFDFDSSRHARQLVWQQIVNQIQLLLMSCLQFVAFLVVPLAGIWAAELNADRLVVGEQGSDVPIQRGLGRLSRGGWRWLFSALTHPPRWLRRSAMRFQTLGLVVLVTILPIAYFGRLMLLHGWASISMMSLPDVTGEQIRTVAIENTRQYIAGHLPLWIVTTAVVAAWPWAFTRWESLFIVNARATRGQTARWIYVVVASVCLGLAALSWRLA